MGPRRSALALYTRATLGGDQRRRSPRPHRAAAFARYVATRPGLAHVRARHTLRPTAWRTWPRRGRQGSAPRTTTTTASPRPASSPGGKPVAPALPRTLTDGTRHLPRRVPATRALAHRGRRARRSAPPTSRATAPVSAPRGETWHLNGAGADHLMVVRLEMMPIDSGAAPMMPRRAGRGSSATCMSTPSHELMARPPRSTRWTRIDKRDATSTRAATRMSPASVGMPLFMELSEPSRRGDSNPRPHHYE
jgi:hypothetical protein